jgi:hypothetical protein
VPIILGDGVAGGVDVGYTVVYSVI